MRYFLGLDNGGTVTKAALFSEDGREICVASKSTAIMTPKPGFIERDMDEMYEANCDVIREVLKRTQLPPEKIAGVGICGHGKGLYLWGKDDKPVRPGILSADNRAYEYPLKWEQNGTAKRVFQLSCQSIMACQPVSLLAWMADHEPELLERIQWIFECKDYVRFRLTGEARGELTDYSGANLVNLHTQSYDRALLALFGLETLYEALPPLCFSAEIAGKITKEAAKQTGLRAGTPVIGGMFDINACALAVNVVDETNICMIAGTWSINEYLRASPVTDKNIMNSIFCLPEYYLVEESSPTSAGNSEWFLKSLLQEEESDAPEEGKSVYDAANAWVEQVAPTEFCPVFLPFLMASNVHPNAKGAFVGISSYHTRAHLMCSVYEGVAFSHRYHLEKLLQTRSVPPQCIRLAGGVARSRVWTQLFADVFQLPVETVTANETGALGCAIAAAAAVGAYASLKEAAANMCAIAPPVLPDPKKAALYDRKYALYLKTIEGLDGVWTDIQAFIDQSAL
ncbi:carbohydrate kinase [Christensenellaceae bacterium OttesenSCG-928-M15]|nr:carbohydrate kinase [Christensenellaceae bacterium OttesenSCG-928-M15]